MRDTGRQLLVLTLALVLICAVLAVVTWQRTGGERCPFLQSQNLRQLLLQAATLIVLSAGMSFVIIAGGIDLSVGSVMALGSVLIAVSLQQGLPLPAALLVGLAGSAACGLVNGVCSVKGHVPPFIATLGMFLAARSVAFIVCGGETVYARSEAPIVSALPFALPVVTVAGAWVCLSGTPLGRSLYAVGANPEASRLSGLNVGVLQALTFVVSGLTAGLASIIYWARTGSGSNLVGNGAELDAIAAVVIGGTSISGGEGHVIGALIGALMMTVLRNGLVLMGLSDEHQKLVIGAVIVAAVLIDRLRARRAAARV